MRTRMLMSVFALALAATPAAAQSEWLAAEGTSIALEYRYPSFDDALDAVNDEMSFGDGGWFLSGRAQVPVIGIAAVAELPFARSSIADGDMTIGNLYLGAEMPLALGMVTLEGGLRLPTMSGDEDDVSPFLGMFSSFADRYDAFVEDLIAPRLGVRTGLSLTDLVGVEVNAAAVYMLYTGEGESNNDVVLDYGVRGFAGLAGARLGAGYEGAWVVTADDEDLGEDEEASFAQIGLWLDYDFGMVRPGVSYFIPLGDYGEVISSVLGLSIEVDLPF